MSTYGTYFGGPADESGVAVAFGPSGEVIVAGSTTSQSLPGTAHSFQSTHAMGFPNTRDVFIAKFDATGTKLLWTTFLGGNADDVPTALTVDSAGALYLTGSTSSSNFPVTPGAYQTTSPGGITAFVSKISPEGSALLYSTTLPGLASSAIALAGNGEVYVAGRNSTPAPKFITPGALANEGSDPGSQVSGVYLLRIKADGSGLVFGAYVGGGGFNGSSATSLAIGPQGGVYVAGTTNESNLPTTANAFQSKYSNAGATLSSLNCCSNGFLIEVNSSGSQVLYGTYFGPQYFGTTITSTAVAPDGSLYFSGATNATTFQPTAGDLITGGGYVAKLTPSKTSLDAFLYLSGPGLSMSLGSDQILHCIDAAVYKNGLKEYVALQTPGLNLIGRAPTFDASYVAGSTSGVGWLVGTTYFISNYGAYFLTPDAFQSMLNGPSDAFLQKITLINPLASIVGSSATGSSPFAAGQLISIYGTQLGPTGGAGLQLGPGGVVTTTSGGTQVTFDGTAAPILYAGAGQVNTVVPCILAGHSSTQMIVSYLGAQSVPITLSLAAAAPGIFTADGSGKGQAAVLNQDLSFNSPSNPAARGSAATLYATGIGATSPCVDGQTYQSNFPVPTLPVVVGVANIGAQVIYAGQAPYLVTGVAQINFILPSDSPTGVVPLNMAVGGVFSQAGVTIAVK